MNCKLGIVILHVQDLEKARAFYVDSLGLEIVAPLSDDNFLTLSAAGEAQLGISGTGSATAPNTTELGFEVEDVDGVYRELEGKGVTLLSEPNNFPFGRAFDAQDPDGNKLSVYALRAN